MAELLQRGDHEPVPLGGRRRRRALIASASLLLATSAAAQAPATVEDPATEDQADEDQALADEARGDWSAALDAWRACAAEATGSAARRCAARVSTLAPQAADGFAGWAVLDEVRRTYTSLGSDAAVMRIEAALAANPDGPAARDLEVWLANEYTRRGDKASAAAARARVAAAPSQSDAARAWVTSIDDREAEEARRRPIAAMGASLAAVYLARAAWGPGALSWRSAGVAGALLGLAPVGFAWAYGNDDEPAFLRIAALLTVAVLLAPRAPVWIAVPGTLGGLLALVWWNGWFPSLGW